MKFFLITMPNVDANITNLSNKHTKILQNINPPIYIIYNDFSHLFFSSLRYPKLILTFSVRLFILVSLLPNEVHLFYVFTSTLNNISSERAFLREFLPTNILK